MRVGAVGYARALAQNTGATWGAKSWAEGQQRQGRLLGQTQRLAAALERHGIPTRLPSEILTLGEVTGQAVQADAWRAIRFLPVVAQRDRKPTLNALKLWQRSEGGKWLRYAVITSGDRVPLGGNLRGRQTEHTRAVSRWAHDAMKDWGVELVFRGTEYTVNDDGVHLHSNVVYRVAEKLSPERWGEFLAWTRKRVGAHWKDCGRIEDMAEVVKYAVKPAELEALADEHVVWLYHETFAKKLCQPMGAFADWLKGLSQDRLKVAQVVDPARAPGEPRKGRLRLVEKPRRDPAKRKERKEDDGESAVPDAPEADAEDTAEVGAEAPEAEAPARRPAGENVLVARTLPQPKFSPWSEPLSLVINYTENPTTPGGVRRLELLRERRAEARRWWDANGAPAPAEALAAAEAAGVAGGFKVHTGSPTVQTEGVAPSPPRRVVTLAGGVLVDGDTGEVLLVPPPSPPAPSSEWVSDAVEAAAGAAARFAAENPGEFAELDKQMAADLRRHRAALAAQSMREAECRAWVESVGPVANVPTGNWWGEEPEQPLASSAAVVGIDWRAWVRESEPKKADGRLAGPPVVSWRRGCEQNGEGGAPCSTPGRQAVWASKRRDAPRPDAAPTPSRAAEVQPPSQGTRLHEAGRSPAEEAGVEGGWTVASTVAPPAGQESDPFAWWNSMFHP